MNDEMNRLRAQLGQMKAELAEGAKERRKGEIRAALQRQQPGAGEGLERLAVVTLTPASGGTEELVRGFLQKDYVRQILTAKPAAETQTEPAQERKARPSLTEMMGDLESGKANLKF